VKASFSVTDPLSSSQLSPFIWLLVFYKRRMEHSWVGFSFALFVQLWAASMNVGLVFLIVKQQTSQCHEFAQPALLNCAIFFK
jgi:hypothetical protein